MHPSGIDRQETENAVFTAAGHHFSRFCSSRPSISWISASHASLKFCVSDSYGAMTVSILADKDSTREWS